MREPKQGRAVTVRKTREIRGWEALAAVVDLTRDGKRPTIHSIARKLNMRPSSYLRDIMWDALQHVPNTGFNGEEMPNRAWRRVYWIDTDALRVTAPEIWDKLAAFTPLQFPMFAQEVDSGIPF